MFLSFSDVGSVRRAASSAIALATAGATAIVAFAPQAIAHPGHGVTPDGDSVAHYLLEPVHGLGLLLVFAAAVAAVVMVIRTRRRAGDSQSPSGL